MFPARGVDEGTAAILELVSDDPVHARDRRAVAVAIARAAFASPERIVDPNAVRELLPPWVYPRVVGAVYRVLAVRGVLVPNGWTISTDVRGRNSGRPARLWRWVAS